MHFNGQKFIAELMGKQVRFKKHYQRVCKSAYSSSTKKYVWEKKFLPEEHVGWVVGVRWLQNGKRIPGAKYYDEYGYGADYDPPYFQETEARTCVYLVVPWPTRKPYKVDPDDVEVLDEPVHISGMRQEVRDELRCDSKNWPRGSDGRFVKVS